MTTIYLIKHSKPMKVNNIFKTGTFSQPIP